MAILNWRFSGIVSCVKKSSRVRDGQHVAPLAEENLPEEMRSHRAKAALQKNEITHFGKPPRIKLTAEKSQKIHKQSMMSLL